MICSDLEGTDLESRLAAADVVGIASQYTGNAAVTQPELDIVVGSQQLTATYDADLAAVRATSQGGHWKITQYMYQQMPEQSGGGCSGI
jgi:hypothetical protein